jgi:hypothetical protein
MAGLLAPKSILETGAKAPIDFGAVRGVAKPVDFGAVTIKPPNAFATTKDTPYPYKQPAAASKDLIENLALAIPQSFAKFALSAGEAIPRISLGLAETMTNGRFKAPGALPPARIPGLGFLGDITSIETDAANGRSLGGSALDIATNEPLGLALKPLAFGVGLLAKGLGKGIPKELAPYIKTAQDAIETQRRVMAPEAQQDKVIFKNAATGKTEVVDKNFFQGTDQKGAAMPHPGQPTGDVLAVVTKDGKVFHGDAAKGLLNSPENTYRSIHQGDVIKEVKGEPVKVIDGIETFLHKDENGNWVVSEVTTGRSLTDGGYVDKNQAIKEARANIEKAGREKALQVIEENKLPIQQETAKLEPRASGNKTVPTSAAPEPQVPPPTDITPPKLPSGTSLLDDVKSLAANEKLNVENFNISSEGKAIIERVVNDVKPQIQKAIGKVLTNKETLQAAEESSRILTGAVTRKQTLDWQAKMLAARQALAAASKDGMVTEDYVKNLLAIKTAGTDIARKLQSLSIGAEAKDQTGKQAIIEAVLKVVQDADRVAQAAKGVDFSDLNQATDFYRKFVAPTKSEWLDLLRYNSMLSSPKTHIVNIFSNLVNTAMVAPIERAIAGGLDFLGSKITGQGRQMFAGESGAMLKGYFSKVSDAAHNFADVMRGKRASTNLDTKSIPIAASGAKGALVKTLAYPMRLLEASDQFFTTLAEGAETGALKYRQGKGVKVGNIESQAQRGAAYRVYRQDLFDENQGHMLDAVDRLTSTLQGLRNNPNPLVSNAAKFTVPFLRTPMNIFKQGLEYSPVGFGTIPGAANKTEQLAKAIIGSSVFTAASIMLASNRLTWGEPIDPAQKQAFKAAGMQAYSMKIGDKWISYQKLPAPIAFPFAMLAAIHDTKENKQIDDNTVDLVLGSVAKYGQFLADQSYAKSIGDLLAAARGGESGIERVVSNYGQQLVPFRALGGWLAKLFDNTQRKIDSSAPFIDQQVQLLMLNIPGLSQKVPARTDASGKPIPSQSRVANAFSPVQFSTEQPGGSTEFQKIMDIQRANKVTSYNTKQLANQTRIELNKLDILTDPEEKKAYLKEVAGKNPELAKKMIAALKEQSKGLSGSDQKLLNAPTETRARFILQQMNEFQTDEEKKAFLKDLAAKKILTADTLKQIAKLKNE